MEHCFKLKTLNSIIYSVFFLKKNFLFFYFTIVFVLVPYHSGHELLQGDEHLVRWDQDVITPLLVLTMLHDLKKLLGELFSVLLLFLDSCVGAFFQVFTERSDLKGFVGQIVQDFKDVWIDVLHLRNPVKLKGEFEKLCEKSLNLFQFQNVIGVDIVNVFISVIHFFHVFLVNNSVFYVRNVTV